MELLTRGSDSAGLKVLLMFPPEAFLDEPEMAHRGEELLFVVEGRVEIRFPDRQLVLEKGDAVQFPGPLRHQLRRLADESCVLICVSGQ